MNICDSRFEYVSSAATSVATTWAKHGFRVRSYEEQKAAAQERMRTQPKPRVKKGS